METLGVFRDRPANWVAHHEGCNKELTFALERHLKKEGVNLFYAVCPVVMHEGKQIEMCTRQGLADATLNEHLDFITRDIKAKVLAHEGIGFALYYVSLVVSYSEENRNEVFMALMYRGQVI
jgi:hypothetical protein